MHQRIITPVTTAAFSVEPYFNRVMALLAFTCAVCALLYGFFLLEAVAHAAGFTEAQGQISALNQELGTLEAQYLAQTIALTPDRAQALGFAVPTDIATVVDTTQSQSLSLAVTPPQTSGQ
jgi:hypothetical protein